MANVILKAWNAIIRNVENIRSTDNALHVQIANEPAVDAFTRLRTSNPFQVYESKNISGSNSNEWSEVITGVIITYNTLVGTFSATEEIRGLLPSGKIAIGDIVTDNGSDSMSIDCDHNSFQIGDTITGQTSGATAVILSVDTGSDIQHDFDGAKVILTVGTSATDSAVRQTYRYHAYIPGKSHLILMTFKLGAAVANVKRRVGYFDTGNGLYLEQNGTTDLAIVRRTNTSGSVVNNRIVQANWNIDKLDGSDRSGLTLDLSKTQILVIDFQWLGVGRIRYGFNIDGKIIYFMEINNANTLESVYMRTPTLPLRFEIANTASTPTQNTLDEICAALSSEGGYRLPGLEFSTPITWATEKTVTARVPILAIRLKNENPAGESNRRTVQYLDFGALARTNDCLLELVHVHDAIDITATWTDISGGSAVEYSTDITDVTGRPSHVVDLDIIPAGAGQVGTSTILTSQFINLHSFLSQSYNSDNSQLFVVYATARTGTSNVTPHITFIEFE